MNEEEIATLQAEHRRYRDALKAIADMGESDARHYAADDARRALDGEDS